MQIDYSKLEEHLEAVNKEFYNYQKDCVRHVSKNTRCIIDSVGGTGKTLMSLTATFMNRPQKVLIICPKNALYTWRKEIQKWYPSLYHPDGYKVLSPKIPPHGRAAFWSQSANFFVCTAAMMKTQAQMIAQVAWDAIIIDEYDTTGIKNQKTKGWEAFKIVFNGVPIVIPMSGTTTRKGAQDLWAVLHLLNRQQFPSYWSFINRYCEIEQGMWGKQIVGPKNVEGFASHTKQNLYRIPRELTDAQRPKLTRQFVPIEMTPRQAKAYWELADEMIAQAEEGLIVAQNTLVQSVKLRQLLVCPKLLGVDDYGASLEMAVDKIKERELIHSVIATPFSDAIPFIKEYCQTEMPDVNIWTLQGGDDEEKIREVESGFRNKKGITIVSISFARSFELESCDNIHFVGYDWVKDNNFQTEWRIQRMTADLRIPQNAYYYQNIGTIEIAMEETLNRDTNNVKELFSHITKEQLKKLLRPQDSI